MAGLTLGIISGAAAAIKGTASIVQKNEKSKNTIDDLNREIESLNKDKEFLTSSFNQSKLQLNSQAERAIGNLNYNIGVNIASRTRQSAFDSVMGIGKQDIAYRELSDLLAQASQKEGSAVQASALTGFRNSGSNRNRITNAELENQSAIAKAKENISMTSAQMFSQASQTYWDYTAKVDSYKNSISDTQAQLAESLANLKLQYDNNMRKIDENITNADIAKDRAKYDGWDIFWDVLSLGMASAVEGYESYLDAKQSYETTTTYEEITGIRREREI